jgi:hypothetical protein
MEVYKFLGVYPLGAGLKFQIMKEGYQPNIETLLKFKYLKLEADGFFTVLNQVSLPVGAYIGFADGVTPKAIRTNRLKFKLLSGNFTSVVDIETEVKPEKLAMKSVKSKSEVKQENTV